MSWKGISGSMELNIKVLVKTFGPFLILLVPDQTVGIQTTNINKKF